MTRVSIFMLVCLVACDCDDDPVPVDSGGVDAPATASCADLGGTCGCAGGCANPDPRSDSLCPQPCDTCGACSQECCFPEGPDGGGVPDASSDAGTDAGRATDAGCDVVAFDLGAVFNAFSSCGQTPSEGDSACLAIDVGADGSITSIEVGPSSTLTLDATELQCVRDLFAGRCIPSRAGMSGVEECAFGF